jgi:hypothetical protein
MPMPIITVPEFANVPFAAGVPFMKRSPAYPPTPDPALATADGVSVAQRAAGQRWGIYNAIGTLAIQPDSIFAFDFKQEYRISDYPVEQGGLQSYNKVITPYDATVIMTKGGPASSRREFLDQLALIVSLLDLYDVVTPDKIYEDVNVVRYDYQRTAQNGVSLIKAFVYLRQVISAPATATGQTASSPTSSSASPVTDPQSPSAADPVSVGTVQPQAPTTAQTQSILQSWGEINAAWGTQGE